MKKHLFLLFALVASITFSKAAIVEGTCGDNLTWLLNTKDSILTISGSGDMYDYEGWGSYYAPWYNYRSYIYYVSFPYGLTHIGNASFLNCSNLTSVRISNNVTSIGNSAFSQCSGMTSVIISNSVISIGNHAFSYCGSLTSVKFGNSITSIGERAFRECTSLNAVYINDITAWCGITFDRYAKDSNPLYYAHNLYINNDLVTNLVIPDGVTNLRQVFCGCTSLTSVSIPNSVTCIGGDAFSDCTGLTSVFIPEGVIYFEMYAFKGCTGLTSIEIPNSVTSIGDAFVDCTNLTSVALGSGMKIVSSAFTNCPITTLTITAATPPSDGVNSGVDVSKCTLFVPTDVIETYANTVWWEEFKEIKAIDGNLFTVSFMDWDNKLIVRRFVEKGKEAIAPEAPKHKGYKFIGWDKDFSNITEDLVVTALYEEAPITDYTLLFTNGIDGSEIELYPIVFELPTPPEIDGFTFFKWIVLGGDLEDKIVIQAVYKSNEPSATPELYTNPSNPAQKLIRNGSVYILTDDSRTYTLTGQEVK